MLQLSFINIVYRKFVKNNKRRGGEGRGGEEGLKREGGLFERGGGGLIEDLQYGWPKENGFSSPEIGYRFWA